MTEAAAVPAVDLPGGVPMPMIGFGTWLLRGKDGRAAMRGALVAGYSPLKRTNLANPVLTEIAAAHDATAAQVVLRWDLEHGVTVLVKSAQPERIAANIDLLRFSLSPGEVAKIDALAR